MPDHELIQSPAVKLSLLDRYLPVWIFAAMISGVLIGYKLPWIAPLMNSIQVYSVSLPIAVGLIWMIYPPLASVNYRNLGKVASSGRVMGLSLVLNWVVGPFLMFSLAWFMLGDLPLLRDGVILIGLARCIAMVLVWNTLAGGNNEYATVLVAVNAAFQILLFSVLAYFFISILPGWISPGQSSVGVEIGPALIARSVGIFLGIPLVMGIITRYALQNRKKETGWYENNFLKKLKPTSLVGLLFTLVVMFSLQGNQFIQLPVDILRVSAPLLAYFFLMFLMSFLLAWRLGFSYEETATTSFTASSNNFELAIAVAVAIFGLDSGQAFATTVGPLIEVPVMLGLVYVSFWMRRRLFGLNPGGDSSAGGKSMSGGVNR